MKRIRSEGICSCGNKAVNIPVGIWDPVTLSTSHRTYDESVCFRAVLKPLYFPKSRITVFSNAPSPMLITEEGI